MTESIIIAIISSGILSTIVSAIITAIANRKNKLKEIEGELKAINKKLDLQEKDALRTQLLLMISDYPQEKTEILKLAEYYFKNLHGNWTATAIFNSWILKYCDGVQPEWFNGGN